MRKPLRRERKAAIGFALCAANAASVLEPSVAHAEEPAWAGVYVNPGAVWSWTNDPVGSSGVAFELSAGYNFQFVDEWYSPHVGGLFRYGSIDDGVNEGSARGAVSAQGGVGPLGVEVGFGWRGAMFDVAPQRNGVIIAPFASAGFVYIGPEWFLPVDGAGLKPELSLNFGLKLPIVQIVWALSAFAKSWGRIPSGRPLRVDGRSVVADVEHGRAGGWSLGRQPETSALTADERQRLADFWLAEASAEHASIPSFALLSLALARFAAPPDLLRRCHRAALDEIAHAEACFALASAYKGEPCSPGALDASRAEPPATLAALACESLVDGWFGESTAAAVARAALRQAHDPAVRHALSRIASQERRHADLARRVVAFAVARAEPDLLAKLNDRVLSLLETSPLLADATHASQAERAHGLLPPNERRAVIARARKAAARQWLAFVRAQSRTCSPSLTPQTTLGLANA